MAVTSKWRHHIERWQSSGLTQADYCVQQQINARTFTARLSEYRKLAAYREPAATGNKKAQLRPVGL